MKHFQRLPAPITHDESSSLQLNYVELKGNKISSHVDNYQFGGKSLDEKSIERNVPIQHHPRL